MYRVVLVDDEPWILSGLRELLDWEALGYRIVGEFQEAEEALAYIRREGPEVVITDIRMPRLSGVDFIHRIRQERLEPEIVLISAYRDFDAARAAIAQGVFQYILKPFDQREVEEMLAALARRLEEKKPVPRYSPGGKEPLSPALEAHLRRAALHPHCYLAVSDREIPPPGGDTCHTAPLQVEGVGFALLCSCAAAQPQSLDNGAGLSRIHPNFSRLADMAEEARFSLECGFRFSGAANPLCAQIQLHICRGLRDNLSLSDIAAAFYLTEPYVSSVFKKNTGSTITAFIQNARTHRASRMLVQSALDLREVAEAVGYADYNYFARLFRRRFGVSPEAYRAGSAQV